MNIEIKNINKSLNKTYLKQNSFVDDINLFKKNYFNFIKSINKQNSEETLKDFINRFLYNTYYKNKYIINENVNNIDLVIKAGNKDADKIAVIIETKAIKNSHEMITTNNINRKAFHEIIGYYMAERFGNNNIAIKHLIITNTIDWFIFDAQEFERIFYSNNSFFKNYKNWLEGKLVSKKKEWFYNEIALKFVENSQETISCTYFELCQKQEELLEFSDKKWIELYKIFSAQHLLKLSIFNDSNTLNTNFYNELLHILGLHEVKRQKIRKIERLPQKKRHKGSLLENTINILKTNEVLHTKNEENITLNTKEEQLFSTALELCIIWLNRIIFLKLLESQLVRYNKQENDYLFLNIKQIKDFEQLSELFLEVLAIKPNERTKILNEKYKNIPYLNSSLFELSEIERKTITINQLKSRNEILLFSSTVLKNKKGQKISGKKTILNYLFEFLDSYNFASDHKAEIQNSQKTIINSSVLGLIFEKINGYKEGSHFTPGFITMYMTQEILRKAVINKFNEFFGKKPNFVKNENWTDLYNKIGQISITEANTIINSIKICDPSVGSGHFLVSALNELINIKSELRILADETGRILRDIDIEVIDDELFITTDGEPFAYNYKNTESRRIQKTLFHEKQIIIENCLFGVDINPKSVNISRLRLWIELLKNTYYVNHKDKQNRELQTLPNIDINIKTGNSLISHFALNGNGVKKSLKTYTKKYKKVVADYKNTYDRNSKRTLERFINEQKENFARTVNPSDEDLKNIRIIEAKIGTMPIFFDRNHQIEWQKQEKTLQKKLSTLNKNYNEKLKIVYKNAFEWRFEFPEVLDDNGKFTGFDVVIGNPPYIRRTEINGNLKPYYQKKYFSAVKQYDLYILFIEKAFQLIKTNGILGFINPKFFVNDYGKVLRKYILENHSISKIIDVGQFNIFDNASTYPAINIFEKKYNKNNKIEYFGKKEIKITTKLSVNKPVKHNQADFLNNSNFEFIFYENALYENIIKKIDSNAKMIGSLYDCQRGIANNKIEYVEEGKYLGVKSYQSKKYVIKNENIKINFINKKFEKKYKNLFKKELILLPRTVLNLTACLKKDKRIVLDRIYFLSKKTSEIENKYILALLNSKLINFWFEIHYNSTKVKGNYFDLRGVQIINIPVKMISISKQKSIIKIVNKILKLKEKNQDNDILILDNQLNNKIYKLYDLTNKEINIIENNYESKK